MYRNILKFLFVFLLFTSGSELSAQRQRTYLALPANAELDKYPLKDTVLTRAEMDSLGLKAEKLTLPWTGFNWYRNVKRFAYDSLPVGTVVLVDRNGKVRYKADCGNRLVDKMEIVNAVATTGSGYAVMPDSSKLHVPSSILFGGPLKVEHSFDERFYQALGERQTVVVQPPSATSNNSSTVKQSFISRHRTWFILGGLAIAGGVYCAIEGCFDRVTVNNYVGGRP